MLSVYLFENKIFLKIHLQIQIGTILYYPFNVIDIIMCGSKLNKYVGVIPFSLCLWEVNIVQHGR